jgi:hypothetical protein
MSLTTSLISLSKYLGLPADVSNEILQYSIEEDEKWLIQIDSCGNIYRKVNRSLVNEVSLLFAVKHIMNTSLSFHPLVVNNAVHHDIVETYVQRSYTNDDGDFEYVLYITNEVSPGRFEYFSVLYRVSPYSTPLREFIRGTVYRPSEEISFHREQSITEFQVIDTTMYISHTEVVIDYFVNTEFDMDITEYL